MDANDYPEGVWLVSFEFRAIDGVDGNLPEVVSMVARQWPEGPILRVWKEELERMPSPSFPFGERALIVAFYASYAMDCFLQLGWPMPCNLVDLAVEFRWLTNGLALAYGSGLLGALLHFGLPSIQIQHKGAKCATVIRGGPWSAAERAAILDNCEADVVSLGHLLKAMAGLLDTPRALLRGGYMRAVSSIQHHGVPIDVRTLRLLKIHWESIQEKLIENIDKDYGVYERRSFKSHRWEDFLSRNNIPWPRLESGLLDMCDDTFREMARAHPLVAPMRELRSALSSLRLSSLQVGSDGRNRCDLSPFKARTGRNQPSSSKFIFGPSVWLRGLIKPEPGWGVAYVDWSQQEFGIAAALSGDTRMMDAYLSGDPYLKFAKQAGAVPASATRESHETERDQFKACALAVQYGMGAVSLAARINQPVERARQLLGLHRKTFQNFWKWSDSAVNEAVLGGRLWTTFGWQIITDSQQNDRSFRNFPVQTNGAEMMRIAGMMLIDSGIRVCAPVHDAFLIEAPLDKLDDTVADSQKVMKEASRKVLNGFELRSEAQTICYPNRFVDKRGAKMWDVVMQLIGEFTIDDPRQPDVPTSGLLPYPSYLL